MNQPPAPVPLLVVSEQDLKGVQATQQIQEFKSAATDVTYRFVRYVWEAKGMIFIPLIEDAAPALNLRYIRHSADATGQMGSDADRYIAAFPQHGLVRFPNEANAGLMQASPVFREMAAKGFSIVAPRWCISALSTLEINPAVNKINQFTIVMPDRILLGADVIERQGQILNELLDLQNPRIKDLLRLTIPVRTRDATGKEVVTPTVFEGDALLADVNFRSQYLGIKTLKPTAAISNTIIGRPQCIDLISMFVIPAVSVPATPTPVGGVPSGFQPPPSTTAPAGTTIPPPSGAFVPPPVVGGGGPAIAIGPTVTLPSEKTAAIDTFLLNSRCRKGGDLWRVDTIIKKITEETRKGFARFSGSYLNLSTCQFGKGVPKTLESWVGNTIPGTNQTLNLSMTKEDIARILTGGGPETIVDSKWNPYIEEVFKRAQYIIFQRMGSTTSSSEEGAVTVPLSILDSIPSGPVPIVRPTVVPKTTFIEQAALTGVIELTVPITDGQRCLPGLGAKKRD